MGKGTEPEDAFNPHLTLTRVKWCRVAKAAGAKAIITAKHHDGFACGPVNIQRIRRHKANGEMVKVMCCVNLAIAGKKIWFEDGCVSVAMGSQSPGTIRNTLNTTMFL